MLLVSAAACGHANERDDLEALVGVEDAIGDSWTADLPETHHRWSIHAGRECLFALGEKRDTKTGEHQVRCLSPEDGTSRWQLDVSGGTGGRPQVLGTEGQLTLASRTLVASYRTSNGELVWAFDPAGRVIKDAMLGPGEALSLNLDGTLLVVLEADTGRWLKGIEVYESKLLAVYDDRAVIGVVPGEGQWSRPALMAVDLGVEGGDTPNPPYAPAGYRWRTSVTRRPGTLWVNDDVLVGELGKLSVWGLDRRSGRVVYKRPIRTEGARARKARRVRGWTTRRSSVDPAVVAEDLEDKPDMGVGQRPFERAGNVVLTQGQQDGVAMRLVRIDAHEGANLAMRWSLSAPGPEPFVAVRVAADEEVALLARRADAYLVDLDLGKELWRWNLAGERSWSDIALGRALYLLYEHKGGASVEARGFVAESE